MLVCQGRAAADGVVAPRRFADPVAGRLLRDGERAPVDRVRAGTPPEGWRARAGYESVRACTDVVVPRTVAIDDAVRARAGGQLVVLGAGLDTRAWRLPELARTDVWEIDHPASQQDKRARLAEAAARDDAGGEDGASGEDGSRADALPALARSVRFTPVDFAVDDLDAALAAAGHDASAPTMWLWEGVVPYLTRGQVQATMTAIAARTAPGSALVVNYQAPSARARAGRLLARVLGSSATSAEPWRSLWRPSEMAELFAAHGFRAVSDDDLLTLAHRLGSSPRGRSSLRSGRVAVAEPRS